MNLNDDTGLYDAYFFTCEYNGEIKNAEANMSKILEWHDISNPIEKLIPYEAYALEKYLEDKNSKFTIYGWHN